MDLVNVSHFSTTMSSQLDLKTNVLVMETGEKPVLLMWLEQTQCAVAFHVAHFSVFVNVKLHVFASYQRGELGNLYAATKNRKVTKCHSLSLTDVPIADA